MENKDDVAGVEFNPPTPTPDEAVKTKLANAQAALAGPERLAKQEAENKRDQAKKQKLALEIKLADTAKQKETIELDWITLDDKRKEIVTGLNPLLTQEKTLEEEEAKIETEEARTVAPGDKQTAENKRWAVQEKRHTLEEKKWELQTKLKEIEGKIEKKTSDYRTLLDQEDETKKQLDDLEHLIAS